MLRAGRSRAGFAGAACVAAIGLGAACAGAGAPLVGIAAAAGLLATAAAYATLPPGVRRDPLNPAVVVAGFIGVLTLGRTAYVLLHERFGLHFVAEHRLDAHESAFAAGVVAQLGGAALVCLGVALAARRGAAPRPAPDGPVDRRLLRLLVLGALAAGVWSLTALVVHAGGLGSLLDVALKVRQGFFEYRGFLYTLLSLPAAGALGWYAVRCRELRTGNDRLAGLLLFAAAAAFGLASGARSAVVFLLLLPAVVIVHYRIRRIPGRALVAFALVVFLASSVARDQTRNVGDPAAQEVYAGGLAGLATNTFASPDARLPDAVAELRVAGIGLRYGATFAAAATAPVPRALWPGKPDGGNRAYTRRLREGFGETTTSEWGLTLAGEAVWNFWWPGLALFLALGYALGVAHRAARAAPGPFATLLYAAGLALALMLVRSDAFNVVLAAGKAFVPALLVVWLVRRRPAAREARLSPRPAAAAILEAGARAPRA